MGGSAGLRARAHVLTQPETRAAALSLTCEPPEHPATGLAGIELAHQALVQTEKVGLLIGGMAREMWQTDTTLDSIATHKDVDVLVLERKHTPKEVQKPFTRFQDGIDWWEYNQKTGTNVNGNRIGLRYLARCMPRHEPGLYLPNLGVMNALSQLEYGTNFMNRHASSPFIGTFMGLPRLGQSELQIRPAQTT